MPTTKALELELCHDAIGLTISRDTTRGDLPRKLLRRRSWEAHDPVFRVPSEDIRGSGLVPGFAVEWPLEPGQPASILANLTKETACPCSRPENTHCRRALVGVAISPLAGATLAFIFMLRWGGGGRSVLPAMALGLARVAEFSIVDLTTPTEPAPPEVSRANPSLVGGQSAAGSLVGRVDTSSIAAELESLRKDLTAHIGESNDGLQLTELVVSLTITAEGGVAFVAKGSAEASISVTFARRPSTPAP